MPILGTSIDAIDLAEDRSRFGPLLDRLGYKAPPYATANSAQEALDRAPEVGFPLLVRPSYVLGGRAMEIVYDVGGARATTWSGSARRPHRAIYLDRFLEDSIEVDVDALCDGTDVWIAGIMQHVEEAGIHSGDSACVLPPHALGDEMLGQIRDQTAGIAKALGVVGLLNVQFAIHGDDGLYVIEANPRASRTVPFVSKAIGLPLAKLACRIMLGERIADLDLPETPPTATCASRKWCCRSTASPAPTRCSGPEMRSTGEVMGIARDFPTAFAKAQAAAGAKLPTSGTVFITVADGDKPAATGIATTLHDLGFTIIATRGTAQAIRRMGIRVRDDQQDRRGLAARRRLDRARRGRSGDQHAGRHRRPHRRIRDPLGRDRPRDPVHHDDGRRDGRGPGDRGGAPRRARRDLAAGDPRRRPSGRSRERAHAWRRSAGALPGASRATEHGAYVVLRCADPTAPCRSAGQFYMLAHGRAVGWGRRRASVPAPRVQRAAQRAGAGRPRPSSQFMLEDVGPGDPAAVRARARARSCCSSGRSGIGFTRPSDGRRALLVGGGVGIAPLAIWQDELGRADAGAARLPRRRARRRAPRC